MAEHDVQNPAVNGGEDASSHPQVVVNVQYLKDLSFENPRAPESFSAPATGPQVSFDVDVKARTIGPDLYESVLILRAEAQVQDEIIFVVEVSYGAVVTIRQATEDMIHGILLIEVPRLLFPFAREIVANATRHGGYPPLLVNPIDFVDLAHRKQHAAAQAANQAST